MRVVYLKKAAGIPAGKEKDLPGKLAARLIGKGIVAEAGTEGGGKSLSQMNVAELKAYALDNGIDLGEATTKADIKEAIRNAETA